tara:strand:- start:191 stop:337 length:147 start_codon:yes stop_codon:yes gene_type:complete
MNLIEMIFKFQNYLLVKFGIGEVVFIRKNNINVKSYNAFVKEATINGC